MLNKIAIFFVVFLSVFGFAKADCQNGAIPSFSNSSICYWFVPDPLEFIEAEISCGSSGGHLASVADGFTNVMLAQHAKKILVGATEFWIGGSDLGVKDQWQWTDLANFTFTNWAPDEPVELPGFDCLGLTVSAALWYTYDCFKPKPYVCEILSNASLPTAGTRPTIATTTQNVTTTPLLLTTPSTPNVVISSTTESLPEGTTSSQGGCPDGTANTGPCIDDACSLGSLCFGSQCCAVPPTTFNFMLP